jgi:hypothetical protein
MPSIRRHSESALIGVHPCSSVVPFVSHASLCALLISRTKNFAKQSQWRLCLQHRRPKTNPNEPNFWLSRGDGVRDEVGLVPYRANRAAGGTGVARYAPTRAGWAKRIGSRYARTGKSARLWGARGRTRPPLPQEGRRCGLQRSNGRYVATNGDTARQGHAPRRGAGHGGPPRSRMKTRRAKVPLRRARPGARALKSCRHEWRHGTQNACATRGAGGHQGPPLLAHIGFGKSKGYARAACR